MKGNFSNKLMLNNGFTLTFTTDPLGVFHLSIVVELRASSLSLMSGKRTVSCEKKYVPEGL